MSINAETAKKQLSRPAGLTVMLTAMVGLNPIAIDAYLPAMTLIAKQYGSDLQLVEHSISTYMLGYALGLLIAAPISDRVGRRPVALIGLVLFALATLAVAFSQSASQLLMFRCIEGIGAGVALVNVGAIIRDLFDERDSATQLSSINALLMTLPLVAPIIGAAILAAADWHWIFIAIFVYAFVVLIAVLVVLPETAKKIDDDIRKLSAWAYLSSHVRSVLVHRRATAFAFTAASCAGALFLFLSDAAFVYMEYFGLSAALFPFAFGANVILMALTQILNIALLKRTRPRRIIPWGIGLFLTTTTAFLIYTWVFDPAFYVVVCFIALTMASQSLIVNNAIAAYMSRFDRNAGMANALSGSLIFTVGALAALLLGILHDGSLRSLATGFFCVALISLFSAKIALKEKDSVTQ